MTIHQIVSPTPVRHQVRVALPPAAAFDLFANRFNSWWPRDKTANPTTTMAEAVLEPREGGRWYETGVDGSICNWGTVLAYEPGRRLLINWQLGSDFKFDPRLVTEVEVLFEGDGTGTLVKLEHRNIERFGADWEAMRAAISSPGGWPGMLQSFVDRANA